jgi:hypothetical protein
LTISHIHTALPENEKENATMRNTTRAITFAAILAITLSTTTVHAAERSVRPRRDRGNVAEMVKQIVKRFFGVVSLGETLTLPNPNSNTPSGIGTGE